MPIFHSKLHNCLMSSACTSQYLCQKAHKQVIKQSFGNLQNTWENAALKSNYDWKLTLTDLFWIQETVWCRCLQMADPSHWSNFVRPWFSGHCRYRIRQNNAIYDASHAWEQAKISTQSSANGSGQGGDTTAAINGDTWNLDMNNVYQPLVSMTWVRSKWSCPLFACHWVSA